MISCVLTIFEDNLVDGSRRSLTYETRLFKYATRGFAVGVPGYDSSYLDASRLNGKYPRHCIGLTKLLVYDQYNAKRRNNEYHARAQHRRLLKILEMQSSDYTENVAKRMSDSSCSTDYAWLPPWGQLTKQGIDNLFLKVDQSLLLAPMFKGHTKFILKDGSTVHLLTANQLETKQIQWVVTNPGSLYYLDYFKRDSRKPALYW